MNYIIDGFNLAFKIGSIATELKNGNIDLAIRKISQFVKSRISGNKNRIILVLDGHDDFRPEKSNQSGISIIFSKKPQTADDIIRDFIRTTKNIRQWCVISSDNEILFTAKDHGAQNMKSADFIRLTAKSKQDLPEAYSKKTDPKNIDMDYWRSVFGTNEDQ